MFEEIIEELKGRLEESVKALVHDLAKFRTGRANPDLIRGIKVDAYGTRMPIEQLASISVPDSRLIVLKPFDKNVIKDIEKAILSSDLGLTPSTDKDFIRIPFPELTEERRRELVKLSKHRVEEAKISVRNIRRDTMDRVKKLEKEGVSEDDVRRLKERVEEVVKKVVEKIDRISEQKEKEIMEI